MIIVILKTSHIDEVTPLTESEGKHISKQLQDIWNFSSCLGSLDGKLVEFRPQRRMTSCYHYYEGGYNGRVCDGGVFQKSVFCEFLTGAEYLMNIPPPAISRTQTAVPYIIVADGASRYQSSE
ncbi:uncharacterized protein LOC126155046 [Schistocerca cancellata]|uniref:uncharacterized protein LOC126155046 n=1 Tax=Schistocerca cancellata TaxID=274614 RepID=UPI002117782C|nr:uncharacterized protein LOC126155046 [Schistocerca cancellata]